MSTGHKKNLKFLMIDNYDSFTFNLVQYLETLSVRVQVVRNDSQDATSLVQDKTFDGFVISPGPSTPKEAGVSLDLVKACVEYQRPLLGVCLGHQAIGEALGGEVIRAPIPVHGKVSPIFHQNLGVFKGLPNPLQATRYHSLIVSRENLPEALMITASLEPDAQGLIMGIRHRNCLVEGIQFHPESVLTDLGLNMLENFVDEVRAFC